MGPIAQNNKYFEVAHHLSPVFTGQGQIGERLNTAFTPSEYKCSFQRRFVLFGMGGAGKTQICLQYAYTYRDRYKITRVSQSYQ
jgi:GTPase SAR1 family protein